jgi:ABC-2 type transport system ATP-binding protein
MIHIDRLDKSFGPVHAVRNLSLNVPAGELFCFLGPNGAGKTTTIKLITGLLRPDRGTVRIGGHDIATNPVEAKKIMGYIPDMPFLYEKLTPVELLKFIADLYNMDLPDLPRRINDLLRQFGLGEARSALIGDLSHGMRQRLLYMAAFLHNPRVVFVDEPLIGLDPHSIRMIKDLLRAKVRDGMTIFLTTHILALAEEIADRIGIISNGSLIALGKLHELRNQANLQGPLEDVFLKLTNDDTGTPTEGGARRMTSITH